MHMIINHSTKEERMKQKFYCIDCDQVFFCAQYKKTHDNSTKHKNLIIANKFQKERAKLKIKDFLIFSLLFK